MTAGTKTKSPTIIFFSGIKKEIDQARIMLINREIMMMGKVCGMLIIALKRNSTYCAKAPIRNTIMPALDILKSHSVMGINVCDSSK